MSSNGWWNLSFLSEFVPANVISKLLAHPAPLPHDGLDTRYWPWEGSSDFSLSLA